MKGVSATFQFLLFFVIGLALFISISSVFRLQLDVFREDVADATRKIDSSFVSALTILERGCISCDVTSLSFKFQKTTANYFYVVSGSAGGIKISTEPGGKSVSSSVHNLADTLSMSGSKSSTETITLTLTKTQNKLEVK